MTENHDYATPAQGTTDWHVPLNENFGQIDTDVEIRDEEASLGNYSPKAGAKFLAIDTGAVYLGDGSSWSRLGEIVPEQTGSGSGSGYHVTVGTTDSIESAINNLPSTGGTVELAPGRHDIDSPIEIADPIAKSGTIRVVGQGRRTTSIEPSGDFPAVRFTGGEWDWTFQDLCFRSGNGSSAIIDAVEAHEIHFERVMFDGWPGTGNGIYGQHCWDWRFNQCLWTGIGAAGTETAGVFADQSTTDSTNQWMFTQCQWEPVLSYALYSRNASGDPNKNGRFRLTNCKIHASTQATMRSNHALVGGNWHCLMISNTTFSHSNAGYIDISGKELMVNNIWTLPTADSTHISGSVSQAHISNSAFRCNGVDAVNISGNSCSVVGCSVWGGDIVMSGSNSHTVANSVF